MTEPLIRPAVDADAEALGVLGRQTFIDTFVDGFGIPYPAGDLARFLDASFCGREFDQAFLAARGLIG